MPRLTDSYNIQEVYILLGPFTQTCVVGYNLIRCKDSITIRVFTSWDLNDDVKRPEMYIKN